MDLTILVAAVGIVGTLVGIGTGVTSYKLSIRRESAEMETIKQNVETLKTQSEEHSHFASTVSKLETALATIGTDMEYVKRGIDDIRLEQRALRQDMSELAERITRVEESSKQAHKRMDRIEGKELFTSNASTKK